MRICLILDLPCADSVSLKNSTCSGINTNESVLRKREWYDPYFH